VGRAGSAAASCGRRGIRVTRQASRSDSRCHAVPVIDVPELLRPSALNLRVIRWCTICVRTFVIRSISLTGRRGPVPYGRPGEGPHDTHYLPKMRGRGGTRWLREFGLPGRWRGERRAEFADVRSDDEPGSGGAPSSLGASPATGNTSARCIVGGGTHAMHRAHATGRESRARRSVAMLREEGLAWTIPQRGSYVAQRP
jgi:hypothetical protein